ncbi:hypothetical protein AMECASPLE_018053 [Ameca splendens]|uniref:Uncharacterized protein n=1 Tax=Ameca splendens TaxID=208324 RepID=A0ABV0Y2F4_9TELE
MLCRSTVWHHGMSLKLSQTSEGPQHLQASFTALASEVGPRNVGLNHLQPLVFLDPLLFAYQPGSGVDDAIIGDPVCLCLLQILLPASVRLYNHYDSKQTQ